MFAALASLSAWTAPALLRPLPTSSRGAVPTASAILSRRAVVAGAGAATLLPLAAQADEGSEIFRPAPGSLKGKTVLITGANTGLGLESAKRLAAAGATIVATSRTEAKAAKTLEAVQAAAPSGARVYSLVLDLGSIESIKGFPARLSAALGKDAGVDVLMNNAGVMAIPERLTTSDGFERQVGVNHLGHFALVSVLLPVLRRASDGFRVINVSSEGHRFATAQSFEAALEAELDPQYTRWGNYGVSKAANILFASELQRRFDAAGLKASAVSLHPGGVATDLGRYLIQSVEAAEAGVPLEQSYNEMNPLQRAAMKGLSKVVLTVEKGANTQVYLAAAADSASGDLASDGGLYFDAMAVSNPADYVKDKDTARRLWELSERLTGMKIGI